MWTKIDKYKKDLEKLIDDWEYLLHSMKMECFPKEYEEAISKLPKEKKEDFIQKLLDFKSNYQIWYSESLVLIKQLLPDRINDFNSYYKKDLRRKEINNSNYVIEDYLQWTHITRSFDSSTVAGPSSAIPKFEQQVNIIKSIKKRFESSLFDIKQLLQADLFDNELESAKELNKKWFVRWAWAIAWVVLEEHFQNICDSHSIKVPKKNPWINDFNDLLKSEWIIEIDMFRFIQRLGDLRNKCDHKKTIEPSKEEIEELINWVDRVIKTVFKLN